MNTDLQMLDERKTNDQEERRIILEEFKRQHCIAVNSMGTAAGLLHITGLGLNS